MILDTSAIIAILFREPEAAAFSRAIVGAEHCSLSAGNYLELAIVTDRQALPGMDRECESFLHRSSIKIEPVTVEQIHIARHAFHVFGRGRHPAGLNYGGCFAYALARITGEPLLFKGNDFRLTDIPLAC